MLNEKSVEEKPILIDYRNLPSTLLIKLDDDFRIRLFDGFSVYFLARMFPNSASSFKYYKRGGSFIPVDVFRKLVKLRDFKDDEINKSIIYIRKRTCGIPIRITLPVFASSYLSELIGHTFGDGHISKRGRFVYVNTSQPLIERVKQLVNRVFENQAYCNHRRRKDGSVALYYPSVVGEFLAVCGCIKGNKFKKEFDVPEWIKSGNKKFKGAFIRALFDDEGTVSGGRIAINMAKQEHLEPSLRVFLNSITALLRNLSINPGNITQCVRRENKNGTVAIGLLFVICGLNELKNFQEYVRFINPKKEARLKTLVESFIQPNYHNGEAKAIILDNLAGQMSTRELSRILDRGLKNTRYHLKMLEKEGKIKKVVVNKGKLLWQKEKKSKKQDSTHIL